MDGVARIVLSPLRHRQPASLPTTSHVAASARSPRARRSGILVSLIRLVGAEGLAADGALVVYIVHRGVPGPSSSTSSQRRGSVLVTAAAGSRAGVLVVASTQPKLLSSSLLIVHLFYMYYSSEPLRISCAELCAAEGWLLRKSLHNRAASRKYNRAVVLAAETGGALGRMVRQLSIYQFENKGRRVIYGTSENATSVRKLLDWQMPINSLPRMVFYSVKTKLCVKTRQSTLF